MTRLPRILHLRTITGKGGGPEKTLLNSPAFLRDRYEMKLAYIRPEGDQEYCMPERAQRMGVELVDIAERRSIDLRTIRRLANEIKRFQPAIIHAHDYKTNILGVLLKKWFRIPCMTTTHGYVSHSARLNFYYRLDRWALRRMDYIVAVSSDLEDLIRSLQIPSHRHCMIHNGIDTETFQRSLTQFEARRELGIPLEPITIGATGRLAAEKAFDSLIEAVCQLRQRGKNIQLVILGDGELRGKLEQQVRKSGSQEYVHLVGYQDDVIPYYQAFDIYALSSLREGLPNVVLEAMAMAVPVVATRVGGMEQLIVHRKNGLLIEPGSKSAMVDAIEQLVDSSELRTQLAEAGRETIVENFNFAQRMNKIAEIYDKLLGVSPQFKPSEVLA